MHVWPCQLIAFFSSWIVCLFVELSTVITYLYIIHIDSVVAVYLLADRHFYIAVFVVIILVSVIHSISILTFNFHFDMLVSLKCPKINEGQKLQLSVFVLSRSTVYVITQQCYGMYHLQCKRLMLIGNGLYFHQISERWMIGPNIDRDLCASFGIDWVSRVSAAYTVSKHNQWFQFATMLFSFIWF